MNYDIVEGMDAGKRLATGLTEDFKKALSEGVSEEALFAVAMKEMWSELASQGLLGEVSGAFSEALAGFALLAAKGEL